MRTPGIVIGALSSTSGKTILSCGLMKAFVSQGKSVRACKCGPDYIDPMFHRVATGHVSENLDLYFGGKTTLQRIYTRQAQGADLVITEGVMGFYDGISFGSTEGSTYEIARALDLPVILVVSCRGMASTLPALLKGVLEFRPDNHIHGIILNRISNALYPRMKEMIETSLGEMGHPEVRVLGFVPEDETLSMDSRHLGLLTPYQIPEIEEKLDLAGRILSETLDLAEVYKIAKEASGESGTVLFRPEADSIPATRQHHIRIAVARDEAFCFYYKANLELLEELGCELIAFSPLSDPCLPDCDGLLLGGGYPEVFAEDLSENETLLSDLRQRLADGLPCLAECGGFQYLQEALEDTKGYVWPMAGVISGESLNTGKLVRFGYATFIAARDTAYLKNGEEIRGHEFHYWDSSDNGESLLAVKPGGKRQWPCTVSRGSIFAGYPHLYYPSNPVFAERFVEACDAYRNKRISQAAGKLRIEPKKDFFGEKPKAEKSIQEYRKNIRMISREAVREARERWDSIGKPLHSLGYLEDAVTKIAGIKRTAYYELSRKALLVFCADNGVVEEGVTQTSQDVTAIVAENFTRGKTCTSRMAMLSGVDVFPVDSGMASDVSGVTKPEYKAGYGTRNFAKEPAMTWEELSRAIEIGILLAKEKKEEGYDILLTGEMGIGNTTTSSALACLLLGKDPEVMTGRGAGLDDERLEKKVSVIRDAIRRYGFSGRSRMADRADREDNTCEEILTFIRTLGGFDIAGMCGLFIGGALYEIPVVVDGFISAVAALCAKALVPETSEYMIASHVSKEPAAGKVLETIGLTPVIMADMSLGEGSGAVALMPLLDMALDIYRYMDTFEEIQVERYRDFRRKDPVIGDNSLDAHPM